MRGRVQSAGAMAKRQRSLPLTHLTTCFLVAFEQKRTLAFVLFFYVIRDILIIILSFLLPNFILSLFPLSKVKTNKQEPIRQKKKTSKIETKITPKKHAVFCVGQLLLDLGPALECG